MRSSRLKASHPSSPSPFVHEYLQSGGVRAYFLRCAKRTTNLASINMGQLRALPVALPPMKAQQHFVERARAIEGLRAKGEAALVRLNELFASLQHRAFSGELELAETEIEMSSK